MRRQLHLVGRPEPPPLPAGEALVAGARRPGELYDLVALGDAAPIVAAKATSSRIGFDVAATLLIEFHLMRGDVTDAGFALPATPAARTPARRLSAAEADYLRILTLRPAQLAAPKPRAAVPVRLLPRTSSAVIKDAAATADLEQAIAWEAAALVEGRTIAELGLLLALRERAGG